MTEEELISACAKQDPKAQKYLYEKYARQMKGLCLRYCKSSDEADDVLQMGFIAIFKNFKSFSGKGSFEGWMKRIFVNMALTSLRKNKKHRFNVEIDNVEYMIQSSSKTSEPVERKDLLAIIQTLPPGGRTIFNLFAIEGYTHKEIAEMLDISEGTSKSQYSRARAYLKKIIER